MSSPVDPSSNSGEWMRSLKLALLTSITMVAFASNSLLCRVALSRTAIDAASFTLIRLVSGALMLGLITSLLRKERAGRGNWISGFMLFAYAGGFSFAYLSLTAATGALMLFGAVQATMIGHGLWTGERFDGQQRVGLVLAIGGLIGLLIPGLSAPPLVGSVLMLMAGAAWGIYSLRGRGVGDPTRVTAGNFLRATVFASITSLALRSSAHLDAAGVLCAVASGAIASGLGYALWYSVLPDLKATNAATVQLSVPAIAALGGIVILGEPLTTRFALASVAIVGGIALVISRKSKQFEARVAFRADPRATDGLSMRWLELKVPPVLVWVAFAVGMPGVKFLTPSLTFNLRGSVAIAWTLVAVAAALVCGGVLEFRTRRTTVNPLPPEDSTSLVVDGIYRFSRNPMYLGFLLALAAWAVHLSNVGAALLLPLFVAYMTRFQIQPEERALLAKFGAGFAQYMSRVRRWL
jgi:protein-S-isoprenylcysteine O-methyltransferase Ste14